MESSECESTDDRDAEQLATTHCTSAQQSGSAPATMIADRLVADRLRKKRHRAEETTEELYTYHSAQGAAIMLVQLYHSSLRNCSTCLHKVRTYMYIYIYKYIYICNSYTTLKCGI